MLHVELGDMLIRVSARPGSARIGLNADQPDPGWWFILALERLGLVWSIKTPATLPVRPALVRMRSQTAVMHRETFGPLLYAVEYDELERIVERNAERIFGW